MTDYDVWDLDEDEYPGDLTRYDVILALRDLFRHADVKTPSVEETHEVCMTEEGEVLAASFLSYHEEDEQDEGGRRLIPATFSVVVAPSVAIDPGGHRRGPAELLIKSIVDNVQYNNRGRDNAVVILDAQVGNPHMAGLLRSLGFSENEGGWSAADPYMTLAVE